MASFTPGAAGPWRAIPINSSKGGVWAYAADEASRNKANFFIAGTQYTPHSRDSKKRTDGRFGRFWRNEPKFAELVGECWGCGVRWDGLTPLAVGSGGRVGELCGDL